MHDIIIVFMVNYARYFGELHILSYSHNMRSHGMRTVEYDIEYLSLDYKNLSLNQHFEITLAVTLFSICMIILYSTTHVIKWNYY